MISEFVKEANLGSVFVSVLTAPEGTPLWYKLMREGRVLDPEGSSSPATRNQPVAGLGDYVSNVVPRQLTRVELFERYADLVDHINDPLRYLERMRSFIRGIQRQPKVRSNPLLELWFHRRLAPRMFFYYLFQAPSTFRTLFRTLLREAARVNPALIPKVLVLLTHFHLNCFRAQAQATFARSRAALERQDPGLVALLPAQLPMPDSFRLASKEIIPFAYAQLQPKIRGRNALYEVLLGALQDYVVRWGSSLTTFDAQHRVYLTELCERAAEQERAPGRSADESSSPGVPPGLVREILDALDNRLRSLEVGKPLNVREAALSV